MTGTASQDVIALVESLAQVGHWRYDAGTGGLFSSAQAMRILGYEPAADPGRVDVEDLYDPNDRVRISALVHGALVDGEPFSFESLIVHADGSIHDVVSAARAERGTDGSIVALVGIVQDVTERKGAERERDRLLERFTLAARAGRVGIWDFDVTADRVVWDETMFALYGIDADADGDSPNDVWADLVHPDDFRRVSREMNDALAGQGEFDSEFRAIRPSGEIRNIRSLATIVHDSRGHAIRVIGTNWDITEVRALAEELRREKDALTRSNERYRALSESIPQLVCVTDPSGRIEYLNARWEHYTGRTIEQLYGEVRAEIIDSDDLAQIAGHRRRLPLEEFECEVRIRRHDGAYRWHLYRSVPFSSDAESDRWIVSATDIEDRKNTESRLARAAAELSHLAHHDPLTDLPNRKLLMDRLEIAIAQAARDQRRVMIVYLDLDRFKIINDRMGHAAGDRILAQTGVRIRSSLRAGDTASRVGGDEFVLVCAIGDEREDPSLFARRLLRTIAEPIDVDGVSVTVDASIGISLFPSDDTDADALVRKADAAMYAAKQSGRNAFRSYTNDMHLTIARTLAFEGELRAAIANREFVVYFQPMISLQSGRLIGAEALVRWQHPQRGLLQPGDFIAFAEEQGMIAPIGDLVLTQTCAYIKQLDLDPLGEFSIAVNVSAQQFQKADFVDGIAAAIEAHQIDVRRLEIEITESIVMGNTAVTVGVLRALRELGVKLSLDDFGTGYSSLSYIKNFPIDTLKIDRSFVRDVATDRTDQALAKTIITLAHSLGMRVVGEGVETPEQRDALCAFGADCCQGYLISHPLPAAEFDRFRQSYRPRLGPAFNARESPLGVHTWS